MSKKLRTPIIKPRKTGGTFYTFGSALEDVGLNINELQNKVVLSHYVLLDIPEFDVDSEFSAQKGDYTFAKKLQNYALNMETVLRNRDDYNFANSSTISEQVFWRFFTKYFGLNLVSASTTYTNYYKESTSNNLIKAIGQISAGAQRTDSYGIYNETFVQVPSSFGTTPIYFKSLEDSNYTSCTASGGLEEKTDIIENIGTDEYSTQKILSTGISAVAIGDESNYPVKYNVNNYSTHPKEHVKLVLDIDELNKVNETTNMTFDDFAIASDSSSYYFNAALIYYTIYNSYSTPLATNLYGILIFDNAVDTTSGCQQFKEIYKEKSSADANGTSYSFRLNIKAVSTYSGDINVNDNSIPSYEMSEDFTEVIRNLADAVDILRRNAGVISKIASDNQSTKALISDLMTKVNNKSSSSSSGSGGGGGSSTSSAVIIDYDDLEYAVVDEEVNAGHIVLCKYTNGYYTYYANMTMFDDSNSTYYFTANGYEEGSNTLITIYVNSDTKGLVPTIAIANDNSVVHKEGSELISGEKTFSSTDNLKFDNENN